MTLMKTRLWSAQVERSSKDFHASGVMATMQT